MTYYMTLEIRTKKALGTEQQEKLRVQVLDALDQAILPYSADVVTADIGGEEV